MQMSRSIEAICVTAENQKQVISFNLSTPGLFLAVPHARITALAKSPNTEQVGESCKVTSLSALHEVDTYRPRLPLYSNTDEDISFMSIAQSADIGSTVGELYDSQQIGLLSEKAGLPLTAYQTDNVTTYVNLLKKLLSDQKAVMLLFNVIPNGPHAGFPNEVTDKAFEHGALALGYLETNNGLFVLAFHWSKLWFFHAEALAHSALSLPTFHVSEQFIEIIKNGKQEFLNEDFIENFLKNGAKLSQIPPKTCASKMSPASLRGTLFATRDSHTQKTGALDAAQQNEDVSFSNYNKTVIRT